MEITINNFKLKKRKLLFDIDSFNISFTKMQLIGKNGTGKTSFFNEIKEGNKSINISCNQLSYINQKLILLPNLSIIENIELLLPIKNTVLEVYLGFFPDLTATKKIKYLSGGQKQLLNFLIGFNQEVDCYLIDEPFNNLDRKIRTIIVDLLTDTTKSFIIVAHGYDLDFCNENLIIENKEFKYESKN